jgi:hypothetical protein
LLRHQYPDDQRNAAYPAGSDGTGIAGFVLWAVAQRPTSGRTEPGTHARNPYARPVCKRFLRSDLASLRQCIRVDGILSCKKNLTLSSGGGLQSYVRPIDAALRPLAQMGVRGLGLIGLSGSSTLDTFQATPARRHGRSLHLACSLASCFDDIVGHCCDAWNALINQPGKIMSLAGRSWARIGQAI